MCQNPGFILLVNVCIQAARKSVNEVDSCNAVVPCKQQVNESCNDLNDDVNRLQLAKLNYVDVMLPVGIVSGLIDSGSELNVLNQSVLNGLDFDPIGEVEFRGIIGEPVKAPIIRLSIRLNDDVLSENDNLSVMFAVCASLNESCILSMPTMCLLTDVLNNKLCVNQCDVNGNVDDSSTVSAVITRSKSRKQESGDTVILAGAQPDVDCPVVNDSEISFLDVDEPVVNVQSDIGVNNANFQKNNSLTKH